MSKMIDERIVQMRFENKDFEENAKQSMSTLDKLKEALQFKNGTKGFEDLERASKNFSLGNIGKGIDEINNKFSQLSIFATRHLQQIADQAWNTGKSIVSALTIDPIKTGEQEYETKIGSIQTILANTHDAGVSLDEVTAALDDLNVYADKTIYNFTEMTRNIGTFTAAGVDLDTSAAAIKGIANLAAVSGSNSEQASRAMYQMSQALSAGALKLQDWNSMVNAGIGGEVFQNALKETARVHGVLIDELIEDSGSFRESLKEGWVTTAVLTETLAKFTGDLSEEQLREIGYTEEQIQGIMEMGQLAIEAATKVRTFTQLWDTLKESAQSGWTESWELIIGDFNEATEFLTEISDTIGAIIQRSADARNKTLQAWHDLGGRTSIINALRNTFNGFLAIFTAVKEGLTSAFEPLTGRKLAEASFKIELITIRFKNLAEKYAPMIQAAFHGIGVVVRTAFDIVKASFMNFKPLIYMVLGPLDLLVTGMYAIGTAAGEFFNKVRNSDTLKKWEIVFTKIGKLIKRDLLSGLDSLRTKFTQLTGINFAPPGIDRLKNILSRIKDNFTEITGIKLHFPSPNEFYDGFVKFRKQIKSGIQWIRQHIDSGLAKFKEFTGIDLHLPSLETVKQEIKNFFEYLKNIKFSIPSFEKLKEFFGSEDFKNSGIVVKTKSMAKSMKEAITGIGSIFDPIKASFSNGITNLKEFVNGIKESITAFVNNIPFDRFKAIADRVPSTFDMILNALSDKRVLAIATTITKFIRALNFRSAAKSLQNVTGMFGDIGSSVKKVASSISDLEGSVSKYLKDKNKDSIGTTLMKMAGALFIVAGALYVLSKIPADQIEDVLIKMGYIFGAMIAGFGVLSLFAKLSKDADTKGIGLALLGMAAAVLILYAAVKNFGSIDSNTLEQGINACIKAISALAIAFLAMGLGKFKGGVGTALSIIAMAEAVRMLYKAVKLYAEMDSNALQKGLFVVELMLITIGGMFGLIGKNKIGFGTAAAILSMVAAIYLLIPPIKILSMMEWSTLIKGMGTMGVMMFMLSRSLKSIGNAKLSLGSAAAITGIAIALGTFTIAVRRLGKTDTGVLLKGMIATVVLIKTLTSSLNKAGSIKIGVAASLLAMAAAIGILVVLVGVMRKLNQMDMMNTVLAVVEVVALIYVMGKSLNLLGGTFSAKTLASVIMMGVVLAGFVLTLYLLKGMELGTDTLAAATAIGVLALTLAGSIKILSNSSWTSGAKAAVNLVEFLVIMGAVILILGGIGKLVDKIAGQNGAFAGFIEYTIDIMGAFGKAIGQFIGELGGALAGGAIEGFGATLEPLADSIAYFINTVGAVSSVDNVVGTIGSVATALLSLGAIEVFDAIGRLGALLNPVGTVMDWLSGDDAFDRLGEKLGKLGSALVEFSNNSQGLDEEAVKVAVNAGKMVVGLAVKIPNSGGLLGALMGENDIDEFGKKLPVFALYLKAFAVNAKGIDEEAVKVAGHCADIVIAFAKEIPNSGGLLAEKIFGDNDIQDFGEKLPKFGSGLRLFTWTVKGIGPKDVETAIAAAEIVATFAREELPDTGKSLIGWITGGNTVSLDNFGTQMSTFGKGLKDFSGSVTGLKILPIANAVAASKLVVGLADLLDVADEDGWYTGNKLSAFGGSLYEFGLSLNAFYTELTAVDVSRVKEYTEKLGDIAALCQSMTDLSGVDFSTLSKNIETYCNKIIENLKAATAQYDTSAKDSVKAYAYALVSSEAIRMANDAGRLMASNAVRGAESQSQAFDVIGHNAAIGFANGMGRNVQTVWNVAANLANTALSALRRRMDEHSPSKETDKIGVFGAQGFINGFLRMNNGVKDAAYSVADTALTELEEAMMNMQYIASDKFDVSPRIRPVVDMSDLEYGSEMMSSLFGQSRSNRLDVLYNLNQNGGLLGALAGMNMDVNSSNTDVVNEIAALRHDMAQMNQSLSRMKVVMDTGSLVGQIIDPIDQQLGVRATRIERGNSY